MARILIGTASWSDPEFARDWYPPGLPAARRLAWYAERFQFVEVNSTFYGIPVPRTVERWIQETPAGFIFDVKLHQYLSRHRTRPEMLGRKVRALAPHATGPVPWSAAVEAAVAAEFLAGIEPLRAAGKLGCLLLQLSPGFSPRMHSLDELNSLLEMVGDRYVLAVELRNRDWMTGEQERRTLDFFRGRDLPMVLVDAPAGAHFTIMPSHSVLTTRRVAYLRLHGRNPDAYLRGKTVADRFRYDYSPGELTEVHDRVQQLADEAEDVHVVFNNNASDYAPLGAERLRRLFGQCAGQ